MTDIIFCHSGPFFALLPHYGLRKSKFWKHEKHTWTYYHFTNVYHKLQSYDVWFLRYGLQQTGFFVILNHFLPFYPPNRLKNQNFKKLKTLLEISSFHTSVPKIMIIRYTVPETWHMTDKIVTFHFGLFFALLTPLTAQKIKISKKMKNLMEISSFYTCVPKIMIRLWFLRYHACRTEGQMHRKSDT